MGIASEAGQNNVSSAKERENFRARADYLIHSLFETKEKTLSGMNTFTVSGAGYELQQNRPNPFTGKTTLIYTVPETSMITIIVCDMSGKNIVSIKDCLRYPGQYTAELDLEDIAPGCYFAKLLSNGKPVARLKMVKNY